MLNAGALPVKISVGRPIVVSASLGRDSLARSLKAGAIGAAAVALFMLMIYRLSGLVADVALAIYVGIVLGTLVALHATLTLHGIAGFILSVGMAVDANVITFERIKEELRRGLTVRAAVEAGFRNAMRAIVDSNVTTLIAGVVLFFYGSGTIRGFAVTLSVGILASMLTAVVITRFLLRNLVSLGAINKSNIKLFFNV